MCLSTIVFAGLLQWSAAGSPAQDTLPPRPALVVLTPTGSVRDGLPVFTRHPSADSIATVLSRGFGGRMLRLYALEQTYLARETGRFPEPAYLVLSSRAGGFARVGFYLDDTRKADAGWVDLRSSSRLTGRFGATDQIFPHELLHVMMRQLAGTPPASGSNQVHAIGVRTDQVLALSEGFAEAMQVLAIDDTGATRETHLLSRDTIALALARRRLSAYTRELVRRWWVLQPMRLRFLLWFSETEQTLRYSGVRANVFAHAVRLPSPTLGLTDPYAAYLAASIGIGDSSTAAKPAAVMLSTEGVVAHLLWRFVSDSALQHATAPLGVYDRFGVRENDLAPLENVFVKLFTILHEAHPATTVALLDAYAQRFPAERARIATLVNESLLGQPLPHAPEIWLRGAALMTGTSVYDQFRARPRAHTFDANAATTLDWMTVPGITTTDAASLVDRAPYENLAALAAAATVGARSQIAASAEPRALRSDPGAIEDELSASDLLPSYLWRIGAIVLSCAVVGGGVARLVAVRHWWSAGLIGVVTTLSALTFAWVIVSPAWAPVVAPLLFGFPWAIWRLARRPTVREGGRALAAWAVAAAPVWILLLIGRSA